MNGNEKQLAQTIKRLLELLERAESVLLGMKKDPELRKDITRELERNAK